MCYFACIDQPTKPMKKTILALCAVASFVCLTVFVTSTGCSSDNPGDSDSLKDSVPVVVAINNSYAIVPVDMSTKSQQAADSFSWRSFIAMNWPANPNTCGPDTTKSILSSTGPVVWETYLSSDQIFVSPGNQPAAWCATGNANSLQHVPAKVLELGRTTGVNRFIHFTSKSSPQQGIDQASGGPLVDQNGRFARYEKRVNHDEYNYIIGDTLWSVSGQKKFAAADSTVNFPSGTSAYGTVGSMEFKAAWKVMGPGDDPTKFYTIQAIVYNDASGEPSPGPNPVTLGLVGLHIAHKTPTQQNWVWSTFEHVDNLTKSFFNPACDTCTPNKPIPAKPGVDIIELDTTTGLPAHPPTQVTRLNATEDPFVDSINIYFQNLLAGSVWANYELISTQWFEFEAVFPSYLANSVQETYLQGPTPASYGTFKLNQGELYFKSTKYHPFSPESSSSCMGCHYIAKSQGIRSDFSFLLGEAQ